MTISKLLSLLCVLAVGAPCLTVRADDNPAQAAARLALAKALFDQTPSTNNPEPSSIMVAPTVSQSTNPATATAPAVAPAVTIEANQKAASEQASLAAALATSTNLITSSSNAVPAKVQANKAAPGTVTYPGQDLGMKQIAAPALPISATKAERLHALLEKYLADQISPEDYHRQRAAILAEP